MFLTKQGFSTIELAKTQLEWMSDAARKQFENTRENPFQFRNVKLSYDTNEVMRMRAPMVVVCSMNSLEFGFSRKLFVEWSKNPLNAVVSEDKERFRTYSLCSDAKRHSDFLTSSLSIFSLLFFIIIIIITLQIFHERLPRTFASDLLEVAAARKLPACVRMPVKSRVPLQGEELLEFEKKRRAERQKEMEKREEEKRRAEAEAKAEAEDESDDEGELRSRGWKYERCRLKEHIEFIFSAQIHLQKGVKLILSFSCRFRVQIWKAALGRRCSRRSHVTCTSHPLNCIPCRCFRTRKGSSRGTSTVRCSFTLGSRRREHVRFLARQSV